MLHSRRSALAAAMVAALAAATGACANSGHRPAPPSTQQAQGTASAAGKNGAGKRRHDLDPLTKRFSALGSPGSASWMSGTVGDSGVPGPSTYWIDAVVTLAPRAARSLRATYAASATNGSPDVVDTLRDELPQGELLTSKQLDAALSQGRFTALGYLDVKANQLVLTAKGQ